MKSIDRFSDCSNLHKIGHRSSFTNLRNCSCAIVPADPLAVVNPASVVSLGTQQHTSGINPLKSVTLIKVYLTISSNHQFKSRFTPFLPHALLLRDAFLSLWVSSIRTNIYGWSRICNKALLNSSISSSFLWFSIRWTASFIF